jgi:hypothetical protein
MPLVILYCLLNVFVQLANKRGFTKLKHNALNGTCGLYPDESILVTNEIKDAFYLLVRHVIIPYKMQALCSSGTSAYLYRTTYDNFSKNVSLYELLGYISYRQHRMCFVPILRVFCVG